jgi:hypothetical protein
MTLKSPFFCLLVLASVTVAQSTQPATPDGQLELRATAAFNRGEYAVALPMLQKLAEGAKSDADRLGRIEEQIRVCRTELKATPDALLTPPAPPPSDAERKPHAPPKAGEVREILIKDLGNFNYDADKGGNIPEDVKRLSGSTVRVRGFMVPMDQADDVTQFALVADLFACCFGQPPQVQHTVIATCPPGQGVSYYPDELVAEGKLKVQEKKEDGFIVSLFELEVTSVKPAAK